MKREAKSIWACERGVVAPIGALALAVILIIAGGGLDLGRTNIAYHHLQRSLDAAVLFGASSSSADRLQVAEGYFAANFDRSGFAGPPPKFTQGTDGSITGSASLQLETTILKVIGFDTLPVVAKATAVAAPALSIDVEFTALAAKGAFAKDIFVYVRDINGQIVSEQKALSYDYDGVTSWTTPTVNQATARYTLTGGTTFGVKMRVYEDFSYMGRRDVSYVDYHSDDPAPRIKTTGSCETESGQTHNWEDGGDSNYKDFIYLLNCYTSGQPLAGVRLTD